MCHRGGEHVATPYFGSAVPGATLTEGMKARYGHVGVDSLRRLLDG